MRSLYWFRSDLRMADNLALSEAIASSHVLIAVFILAPSTWKAHDAAPCKIRFLLENLKSLSETLWKHGIPLLIRTCPSFSDCPETLDKLCKQHNIDAIYFNHEYPLDEKNRDEAVINKLPRHINIHAYHQQLILPPGTLFNKQGLPFQVFTPFKKAWLVTAQSQQAWCTHKCGKKNFISDMTPDPIPEQLEEFTNQKIDSTWEAGEKSALKKLKIFCQDKMHAYQKHRDFPNIDGTSQLSPYLAQGVISPRQCISAGLEMNDLSDIVSMKNDEGTASWISEFIWRDFYHHIIHFHPDICRHKPFKLKTDNIPWCNDKNLLTAWQSGMTGFPIVDAGMRQLQQTGWMHNRLRMITAMFLSKILLIDWRLGEKHFMAHLIDGDFASNNGGWQWCASTGVDATPYFRIFNPTLQSQRFDPSGAFIKHFCPELSSLDSKTIHAPYSVQKSIDKIDYPPPIVDYRLMRQKTLECFKKI